MSRSGRRPAGGPGIVECPPGCSGVVGWPSRISGSVRVSIPDVREWLGNPIGCPGVVGKPS